MVKCKYCGNELAENGTFCPNCGKNNAQEFSEEDAQSVSAEAETPAEEKTPEIKEGEKASPTKIALAVTAVVLLLAILIALLAGPLMNMKPDTDESKTTEGTAAAEPEETTPPTIPADGNPDDETCKGSYTAEDAAVMAGRDTVVATVGDHTLTNGQLQVYYWLEVQNFLGQFGSYAPYFGLDYTQPLDMQTCTLVENGTWQQFFLGSALRTWQNWQALSVEADRTDFQLEAEDQQMLDGVMDELEENARNNGFANGTELLHSSVGVGAELSDYEQYMHLYLPGYFYFADICAEAAPSDAEVEAYFDEHAAEYADSGITKDAVTVDVRHILLQPEGGVTDETGKTTYSAEEWAACEAAAQEIYDAWLAGERTEDSFAKLADEHSADPGSNTNGGLYTNVEQGQMVEPFDAWCFDGARQAGDHGLVRTDFGYHIMYFADGRPMWKANAEADLSNQISRDILDEIIARYPMDVKYSEILLGFADLTK